MKFVLQFDRNPFCCLSRHTASVPTDRATKRRTTGSYGDVSQPAPLPLSQPQRHQLPDEHASTTMDIMTNAIDACRLVGRACAEFAPGKRCEK